MINHLIWIIDRALNTLSTHVQIYAFIYLLVLKDTLLSVPRGYLGVKICYSANNKLLLKKSRLFSRLGQNIRMTVDFMGYSPSQSPEIGKKFQ